MALTRAQLARSTGIVTYAGATLFPLKEIVNEFDPVFSPVSLAALGEIDDVVTDRVYKVPLLVWGAYENLSVLFPGYLQNPQVGASIFGASDVPLVVQAKNGSKITYTNAQVTKLLGLHLGVDSEIFSAALELTCLIADGANPEDAGAYYAIGSASYDPSAFSKTNYSRKRWTAAWGSRTGFTTIYGQKGFDISWDVDATPSKVEGFGTRDMYIGDKVVSASVKCVPIGPSMAQMESNSLNQGTVLGTLRSSQNNDFVITGGANSVTLKAATLIKHKFMHNVDELQVNEATWKTVRGITSGVGTAVSVTA